jgi:6-phosphogluconolactonase
VSAEPARASRELRVYPDAGALASAAADLFLEIARRAIQRGPFRVALSGGSTPRALYTVLASRSEAPDPPLVPDGWRAVDFFWGDERHVPPQSPSSNYRMALEALLSKLPVPAENVHRIRGELPDASVAAEEYERELRRVFRVPPVEFPRFDLVLLGLGPDGHTASLFPETPALEETKKLAVANPVEKLGDDRITLTVPVFNRAACVAFLVSGEDKARALSEVLEGPPDPRRLPAQRIRPENGRLLWLVDRAAAARLASARSSGATA